MMILKTGISLLIFVLSFDFVLGANRTHTPCPRDPLTEELLADEDPFRALGRLKEVEFKLRGKEAGFSCALAILQMYLEHQEWGAAERWLDDHLKNYTMVTRSQYHLWKVELAFLYRNYEEALRRTQALAHSDQNRPVVYATKQLSTELSAKKTALCLGPECSHIDQVLNDSIFKHKKSVVAGTLLGIIPGAGQMYAGRWTAGLGSLIINSLFIGLTAYALQRHENAAAALSGIAAITLYGGSIYAGYEATRRYNEVIDQRREKSIHDLRLGITLPLPE